MTSKELKLRWPPLFSTFNFAFGLLRRCRRYMCCAMTQLLPEGKKVFFEATSWLFPFEGVFLRAVFSPRSLSLKVGTCVTQFTTRRRTLFLRGCHVIITPRIVFQSASIFTCRKDWRRPNSLNRTRLQITIFTDIA